jgi:hypothetical protein
LRFCQERNLGTDGLKVTLETERDASKKRIAGIRIAIELPEGFPERYSEAIVRAVFEEADRVSARPTDDRTLLVMRI